jgi:uncharacterized RDD family membrane protein YckC
MNGVPMSPFAPPPSISRRITARLIDYLVVAAASGGLGAALGFGFIWLLFTALLVLAYFVVGDAWSGTTIGKAALGLRVEGASGRRPSFVAALTRESFVLLGAVPFVGPFLALVAWVALFVTIRSSPQGQGWHDRWAGGTRVVRKVA